MTFRMALLTAAAFALPAGAAFAQTPAQTPAKPTGADATSPAMTPPVAAEEPATTEPAPDDLPAGPASDTVEPAAAGAVTLATAADVTKGVVVHDQAGAMVGTVESVDANGAVVATGKSRVQIPLASFGKNDKGLVIGTTKADLDAQAAAKTPA